MSNHRPRFANAKLKIKRTNYEPFLIIKRTVRLLRANGATAGDIEQFVLEATKGDFVQLITTLGRWVTVVQD